MERGLLRRTVRNVVPRRARPLFRLLDNWNILAFELGQAKSLWRCECVDRDGNPIPWYTYPAIEFIEQLDFSNKIVFEYGSGYSSIFWARRCKKIVSIEDNREWYEKISKRLPRNAEYHLLQDKETYIGALDGYPEQFDVIIVDSGQLSYRHSCAVTARRKIKSDGLIIVDNSDWLPKTCQFLRESDLIEVDMAGFGPLNSFTWTTSFFLSRNIKLAPAGNFQPKFGPGALHIYEEQREL